MPKQISVRVYRDQDSFDRETYIQLPLRDRLRCLWRGHEGMFAGNSDDWWEWPAFVCRRCYKKEGA